MSFTSTFLRDQASQLAKSSPVAALEKARKIPDPWFRAQALAWVARFTTGKTVAIAKEAAKAAAACDDAYKQSAVRSWEVAALAETGAIVEARKALDAAVKLGRSVSPASSRAEALFLLCQAAAAIGQRDCDRVVAELVSSCGGDSHWRCKRAIRDATALKEDLRQARPFFW